MPLSYRNILNVNQLTEAITTGNWSNVLKKGSTNSAKYIKGYADDTAIESLANSLNINKGLFKQIFGAEDKELDAYDPNHIGDAKGEEFWFNEENEKIDGKAVQLEYDEDTNTFKRGFLSNPELGGYGQTDFWYEDPFIPKFELFFHDETPFFNGTTTTLGTESSPSNCLYNFIQKYEQADPTYSQRFQLWVEFKRVFFKIFEKELKSGNNRNRLNKAYYISKIQGLENLNKKMINYGEDKISITMNEDVSMVAWYLSELYNNIVYSYKNQRYMFPENAIRFDMTIIINEMRNFQKPESNNYSSPDAPGNKDYLINKDIKNIISKKSEIVYTLHDCTFDFFSSKNYKNEMEIGGYGTVSNTTPETLTFDIIYKSVTRESTFPLLTNSLPINAWGDILHGTSEKQNYFNALDSIKEDKKPEKKGYLNNLLSKAKQTVTNQGLNYLDNLETKLREVRGSAVNSLLSQFRDKTNLNKIEPDNVYEKNFNDRTNLGNLASQIGGDLLNNLEDTVKSAANF